MRIEDALRRSAKLHPRSIAVDDGTVALDFAALAERACAARGPSVELTAHRFIIGLLDWAGWGPDFEVCGRCAAPITAERRPIVEPRGSGLMCARHEAESVGHDPDDHGYRPSRRVVDGELLEYVRGLRAGRDEEPSTKLAAAATALVHRLVDLHIDEVGVLFEATGAEWAEPQAPPAARRGAPADRWVDEAGGVDEDDSEE